MINLIFFAGAIVCAIAFNHPIALGIGWLCAFAYSIKLNGRRAVVFNIMMAVLATLFAVVYASFNHFGVTEIGRNAIGNRYTLESFIVGIVIGVKADIVIMWLSCLLAVFTSDKVAFLLGRCSPRLSLMFSVLLRLVPRTKLEAKRIDSAQSAIGCGARQGSLPRRIRNGAREASQTITWAIDNAMLASDSMRSRGAKLQCRSAFSIYRFDKRDRALVIALFFLLSLLLAGVLLDQMSILYNPEIVMNRMTPLSWLFFAGYLVFCLLPLMLEIISEWNYERLRHG